MTKTKKVFLLYAHNENETQVVGVFDSLKYLQDALGTMPEYYSYTMSKFDMNSAGWPDFES